MLKNESRRYKSLASRCYVKELDTRHSRACWSRLWVQYIEFPTTYGVRISKPAIPLSWCSIGIGNQWTLKSCLTSSQHDHRLMWVIVLLVEQLRHKRSSNTPFFSKGPRTFSTAIAMSISQESYDSALMSIDEPHIAVLQLGIHLSCF
jgi:hypothetical protein